MNSGADVNGRSGLRDIRCTLQAFEWLVDGSRVCIAAARRNVQSGSAGKGADQDKAADSRYTHDGQLSLSEELNSRRLNNRASGKTRESMGHPNAQGSYRL